MTKYVEANQKAGREYFSKKAEGEIFMLNLLRFNEIADYTTAPEIAPPSYISGAEAYDTYIREATPILKKFGSQVLFKGKAGMFLVGPDEGWDLVLLVKHKSKRNFLALSQDPEYLAIAGHRVAALDDSRLLPLSK